MPFKANNNRFAVVVCARHVVKRPSKRSVLVIYKKNSRLEQSSEPRSNTIIIGVTNISQQSSNETHKHLNKNIMRSPIVHLSFF